MYNTQDKTNRDRQQKGDQRAERAARHARNQRRQEAIESDRTAEWKQLQHDAFASFR